VGYQRVTTSANTENKNDRSCASGLCQRAGVSGDGVREQRVGRGSTSFFFFFLKKKLKKNVIFFFLKIIIIIAEKYFLLLLF